MGEFIEKVVSSFEIGNLQNVKEVNTYILKIGKWNLTLNVTTLVMTWITMIILIVLAYIARKKIEKYPSKLQALVEMIISGMDDLTKETLGVVARKYFPLITTLLFFVLISNWLGCIPTLKSPTQDLNTTLGLGLMVFVIVQASAIWHKGIIEYVKGFFQPYIIAPLMFPLNVVGEIAKVISHSFRLFGNILGGSLIILVLSELIRYFILPIGLYAFFGFFSGTIQAFVFSILALVYIAIARG
ncbi:MAG: F0F1 ATP synthase subunit A [bacterium]|nr:F0F1 ATP synthase subunit A [bacterium]